MMNMMMMKPTALIALFVLIQCMTIQVLQAQGVQKANTQLTANSPIHCQQIIDDSTFEGNCCSLNVTAGNGCILNVVNGRCAVSSFRLFIYLFVCLFVCMLSCGVCCCFGRMI